MNPDQQIVPVDQIEQTILLIRGQRVILDADLARLYGVPTKRLNEAVRRNAARFPDDFAFRLTFDEARMLRSQSATLPKETDQPEPLRSQIATSKPGRGGRRYLPFVFTEHGAIMAANVLNSPRAIKVGLFVVRAFVKLREMLSAHRDLAVKLDELERKLEKHDHQIIALIDAIRQLMTPPPEPKRKPIGFHVECEADDPTRKAKGSSAQCRAPSAKPGRCPDV